MYTNVDIRPVKESDLKALTNLEELCFVAPWKEKDVLYEIKENPVATFYVLEVDNKVMGFIDFWITFDSATLAQIAIHPSYRGKGLAKLLMDEMIKDCHANKVDFITLEVRTGNEKAIKMYEKYKFETILTKKQYYTNGDDAYYMIRKVEML